MEVGGWLWLILDLLGISNSRRGADLRDGYVAQKAEEPGRAAATR
jgi:hypothetical protein